MTYKRSPKHLREEAEKAFKDIKELLTSPLVLRELTPDGLFCLESDTSHEGDKSKETNGLLLVIIPKD